MIYQNWLRNSVFCFHDGVGLESRYRLLRNNVQQAVEKSEGGLIMRKQFEADCLKVEQWLQESRSNTVENLDVNLSVHRLNEQLAKYQVTVFLTSKVFNILIIFSFNVQSDISQNVYKWSMNVITGVEFNCKAAMQDTTSRHTGIMSEGLCSRSLRGI